VALILELVLVVLSTTSSAATSLFPSDMERACSHWADWCRMLDRGDLLRSMSAVARFPERSKLTSKSWLQALAMSVRTLDVFDHLPVGDGMNSGRGHALEREQARRI
jgi:hypothetical protein